MLFCEGCQLLEMCATLPGSRSEALGCRPLRLWDKTLSSRTLKSENTLGLVAPGSAYLTEESLVAIGKIFKHEMLGKVIEILANICKKKNVGYDTDVFIQSSSFYFLHHFLV